MHRKGGIRVNTINNDLRNCIREIISQELNVYLNSDKIESTVNSEIPLLECKWKLSMKEKLKEEPEECLTGLLEYHFDLRHSGYGPHWHNCNTFTLGYPYGIEVPQLFVDELNIGSHGWLRLLNLESVLKIIALTNDFVNIGPAFAKSVLLYNNRCNNLHSCKGILHFTVMSLKTIYLIACHMEEFEEKGFDFGEYGDQLKEDRDKILLIIENFELITNDKFLNNYFFQQSLVYKQIEESNNSLRYELIEYIDSTRKIMECNMAALYDILDKRIRDNNSTLTKRIYKLECRVAVGSSLRK